MFPSRTGEAAAKSALDPVAPPDRRRDACGVC